MGGTTDIYVNLRDARSTPEAISFLSGMFANPLRRLCPDRFVEVPDAVSCFAGVISSQTKLPYITVRESPKENRVSKAQTIGAFRRNERVVIIDDVITDGASKIVPINVCRKEGLNVSSLVVLVDREQGWRQVFREQNLNVPVWPAMKLHDIRRYLIKNGIMRRCDPGIEQKNPIILALDGKSWDEILPLISILRTTGCVLKVNDLLFYEGFKYLLPELGVYGRFMVDIKGHDIPNTLENICKRLLPYKPWAVTIHGSGGKKMIEAVVKAFQGTETKVLVVTVLTSMDEAACEDVYHRRPLEQVEALAKIAKEAGAQGLVCSPQEVGSLKQKYPDLYFVTPGIRSEGADVGDQKRIGTPKGAMDAGSNGLVIGRQIMTAADPVAEVKRILSVELGIN